MRLGLLGSGIAYTAANVLSAGVPFLLLPVLTRVLQPDQYGQVVSFQMLVALCGAVAGLGLQSAVSVRWLDQSKGDPRRYTATAIALVLLSSLLAAALSLLGAPLLNMPLSAAESALAALVAASTVLQGMRFAVWQSQGKALHAAALQVFAAALNMGLSLVAVLLLHLGGSGRILGLSLAAAVVAALSVWLLWRAGEAQGGFCRGDALAQLRYGGPLIPHALAGALLGNADRLAVSAVADAATLGVYGAAAQLGLVIGVIADAAVKTYTPLMYRLLARDDEQAKLTVVGIAYASIPFWLGMALLLWGAYQLVAPMLLGPRFVEASQLSIWFLLGGAVSAVYLNVAGLFFFTGRTEAISAATLVAAGAATLIAAPAVKTYGTLGGGLTYLGAQIALLAAAWLLSVFVNPMPWRSPMLALRQFSRRGASQ